MNFAPGHAITHAQSNQMAIFSLSLSLSLSLYLYMHGATTNLGPALNHTAIRRPRRGQKACRRTPPELNSDYGALIFHERVMLLDFAGSTYGCWDKPSGQNITSQNSL